MTELNSLLMILIPIGAGLAIGQLMFRRRGESAVEIYSAFGAVTGAFWVMVGVFMIVGGLHLTGALIIAVFFYLGQGNWSRFKSERSARTSVANWGD